MLLPALASGDPPPLQRGGPCVGATVQPTVVAFIGVDVVPMDGERLLERQTVVVRDGRIAAIGAVASTPVPDGAAFIEGHGRYLMPGIAEMHAHVPGADDPAVTEIMALYALTGATTIRAMLGTPFQFELRRRIESGEMLGPTLFIVAPPFNRGSVTGPEDARDKVRNYRAAGYDQLKIFGVPSQDSYDALAGAAHALGMRFGGHVPENIGLRHALAMRQSVEHLDGYLQASKGDPERINELARLTREAGVWNAPTMDVWKTLLGARRPEELDGRPELVYLPRATIDEWRQRTANLASGSSLRNALVAVGIKRSPSEIAELRDRILVALHRGGARLLLGADSPQLYSVPGFSLAHELRAMVEAGLPIYNVLEAATRNPAEYFGQLEEFGMVVVGKRADLILLEGNPLQDVRNVHRQAGVMLRGRWLPKEEIGCRLKEIAAKWR